MPYRNPFEPTTVLKSTLAVKEKQLEMTVEIEDTERIFRWRMTTENLRNRSYASSIVTSHYEGILTLELFNTQIYLASPYWQGTFPVWTPFTVTEGSKPVPARKETP